MSITGMPKGSKLVLIIVALVLIGFGAMSLSNKGMWKKLPGILQFENAPARLASCGLVLVGIGLLFMQGMRSFENTAFIYNTCMAGFYGGAGLGIVLIAFAFIKR